MEPNYGGKLPPLPACDPTSLEKNRFDGYYKIGARDFWADNEVNREEIKPFEACDHYFQQEDTEVRCIRCHIGYEGPDLKASNGKLYLKGEPIAV